MTEAGRPRSQRWLPLCAALLGCAHVGAAQPSPERELAFRKMVAGLPPCPPGLAATPLDEALGRSWAAGDCGLLRGWLDLVRNPPPCGTELAADLTVAAGEASEPTQCGVGWVLSSGRQAIAPSAAPASAGVAPARLGIVNVAYPIVTDWFPLPCVLDDEGNAVIPGIHSSRLLEPADDLDLLAAHRASLPVEVAILGAVPGDDSDPRCVMECDNNRRRLGARPFEVTHVCRIGGPPRTRAQPPTPAR